jgi:hypothetical protein
MRRGQQEQPEQGSQLQTDIATPQRQENLDRTVRTGQPGQDCQERTARKGLHRKGLPGMDFQVGLIGQNS